MGLHMWMPWTLCEFPYGSGHVMQFLQRACLLRVGRDAGPGTRTRPLSTTGSPPLLHVQGSGSRPGVGRSNPCRRHCRGWQAVPRPGRWRISGAGTPSWRGARRSAC